jgi:hypothetical protein
MPKAGSVREGSHTFVQLPERARRRCAPASSPIESKSGAAEQSAVAYSSVADPALEVSVLPEAGAM